jgi:RNA-directed DNA polymerase
LKRVGHLLEQATSFENLWAAARLAKQGCGATPAASRFWFYLEPNLLELQAALRDGTYRPGSYRYFTIRDPKIREIAVAPFRDRVVHHALVRVLTPIYERVFIFDSYATRPGKGTHAAVRRAQTFARRWPYYLKTDIAKYFESVDHASLIALLEHKIKDRAFLDVLARIIRNTRTPGKGLPIGNLTSQFLANVYLDPCDHVIKEQWGVRGYVRYMDDLVLFGDTAADVQALRQRLAEWLTDRLQLRMHEAVTVIQRSIHGLNFLGWRIFPAFIRMRPANRRRSLRRLKQAQIAWMNGKITEEQMQQKMASLVGHLTHFSPHASLPSE